MISESLPAEWTVKCLMEINAGGVTSVNPLNFPQEMFEYYSIPAYQEDQTPQMTQGDKILSQKLLIPPRCVLFGKLNPRVQKVWNVRQVSSNRSIASTEWFPIVPNRIIDQDFVYFLLLSNWVMPIAQSLVSGSTPSRQRVNAKAFYEISVPIPEFNEQKKIAKVLRLFEEATQFQQEQVRCLQNLKRATMQKLFTCGLRSEPQKQTEIGLLPESWEAEPLGNHFEIVQGLSLKRNLATDGTGVPFLRTSNVYWGRIDLSNVSRMNVDTTAIRDLRSGDLLVCEGGEIGRAAIWSNEIANCTYQNHVYRLRPIVDNKVNPKCVMSWLEEGFCHRQVYEGAGNRTTIPNLSRSRLSELKIPVATLDEQNQIVAILDAIDRKINLHRKKRAVLDILFKTLLHQLMTGEIRVSDLELSEGTCSSKST